MTFKSKWLALLGVIGLSSAGCSDSSASKHFSIPDQRSLKAIEFAKQSDHIWRQIGREKWPEVLGHIRDNQVWQPKLEGDSQNWGQKSGGDHLDLPGFAYHLRIRHSNGVSTLLSFFSGDKLFCEDGSPSLYEMDRTRGESLRHVLETSR